MRGNVVELAHSNLAKTLKENKHLIGSLRSTNYAEAFRTQLIKEQSKEIIEKI